jgi:superfamily II RNA helicase
MLDAFLEKIVGSQITLYPAQEEAILEVFSGNNIILNTPTGSGKSLVALAMHFKALQEGKRSFYTCPIKALVSEKFFSLCETLGAENIGMMTGDASVNKDAPIICCTAEILSNLALRGGAESAIDYVVMDEFHYYSDPERGIAWQIPLLTMSKSRFLLMSATLGDTSFIKQVLEDLTGRQTAVVSSDQRPVPLDYTYCETPIHETLAGLISSNKYPIYVVNFTQRECVEQAQNAMSVNISSKEDKKKIETYFEGFRFDTPFGKEMRRYLSHGIGLHNAGILPKYRLLVEKLAQTGLLKIIMGTDTLGVGVNIPIRSVLFTKLCKFDGVKTGILSVRDFKQIAGRAGRKGFDEEGSVLCQAPEHVIENKRQENRFGADPKLKKKIVKKAAPTVNYVHWDEKTFQKLIDQPPEPLISRFTVSHGLIMTLLQAHVGNANPGYQELIRLISKSHETSKNKSKLRRQAAVLLKSLLHAGLVSVVMNRMTGSRLVVNETLQHDFSLHHTLSLYLLHALNLLDETDPEYALNVLSLVESIAENPKVILMRQVDKLKTAKMAEMRAEGLEYEERMAELEKVEHPKPLRDFIYGSFNAFEDKHPWVGGDNIQPKSVARDMFERLSSFNEYIKDYGLERSEGVLLRYLSLVYKTLLQTVPETYQNEAVHDIRAYLKTLLAQTDSSLIAEWEQMLHPSLRGGVADAAIQSSWVFDEKKFISEVRAMMHQLVKALSQKNYDEAKLIAEFDYEAALKDYYDQYDRILSDANTRLPVYTRIKKESDLNYRVTQVLLDPDEHNEWYIEAVAKSGPELLKPELTIERVSN